MGKNIEDKKPRDLGYEEIVYPHIRHLEGITEFEAPERCEVKVKEDRIIISQGEFWRVIWYEDITEIKMMNESNKSRRFLYERLGKDAPVYGDGVPEGVKTWVKDDDYRDMTFLDLVIIKYKEDALRYKILLTDDIDSNPMKECLDMAYKIEYQYYRIKHGMTDE